MYGGKKEIDIKYWVLGIFLRTKIDTLKDN